MPCFAAEILASHRADRPRALRAWIVACAVAATPIAHAQVNLPEIGTSADASLSSSDETRIGEAFMRELRANLSLVDDPEVETYIQSLGYRIASHSGATRIPFTFFVVKEKGVNAFAVPGGFIGINAGLITTTETEGELAAVLAHEVAHVTQRHIARAFELADQSMVPTIAGLIAAILIGSQNAQAGAAAASALQARNIQSQIDFTRANEQEADRVGIAMLADAGFDPRAMPAFFERLQLAFRYYSEPPEFLSTHPVTTSRIADSRSRAESYPYNQHEDSIPFHLVRAKLQVMAETDHQQAVVKFKDLLDNGKYRNLLGARYGYALALTRVREYDKARKVIESLIEADPERLGFYDALAQIEIETGNFAEAVRIYKDNMELYPGDRMLTRGYVDALIKSDQPERALSVIDRFRKRQKLDVILYKAAAQAYENSGNKKSAHASLAEHYYLLGQLETAIHHLELAVRVPGGDFYQNSSIEARLEELETEQRKRKQK